MFANATRNDIDRAMNAHIMNTSNSVFEPSDENARDILHGFRHQAFTLFRALDTDGDGRLSPSEIDAAPEVLRRLDTDGDGYLNEIDVGGPTEIPGLVRRSAIVRLLDEDGDLIIGPDDISQAAERIRRLDTDGDGYVTMEDDIPDPSANHAYKMPMGTPAQTLAFQRKIFSRASDDRGPLPPRGRRDVQDGYMLIQEVNDRLDAQKSSRTFLMDGWGKTVHTWPTPQRVPEGSVSYLMDDGNLLRTTCKFDWLDMEDQFPIGANGTIAILAPDGTVKWEWDHLEFGVEALHHDIEMLPNGNILAICWHVISAETANSLGWAQQGLRQQIVLDKLYEIKPDLRTGEAEIVWEWAMADHVIQNLNPDSPNFGDPAAHPEKININWPQLDAIQFNSNQLVHANSVSYSPKDDVILLSSAIFGELWAIDHSTTKDEVKGATGGRYGRGGDLIWRWGNPQTQGLGGPDEQRLFWQHDAHFQSESVLRRGEIMVFNNGMRRDADGKPDSDQICMGMITGAYSDVIELTLPRDAEGMIQMDKPPVINWQFNADGNLDIYSPFMSNAHRLPNGNTVMVQACDKRIVEVTLDGEIVMDFRVGGPGRMYRVKKYSRDHPGITALGLQPRTLLMYPSTRQNGGSVADAIGQDLAGWG